MSAVSRASLMILVAGSLLVGAAPLSYGQARGEIPVPPELPNFPDVSKGFTKVTSSDKPGMYTLYKREGDNRFLAELPREFENKRFYIAPTVAGGDLEMGVYGGYTRWGMPGDRYVYWSRYDKRIALIEPNLGIRSLGDEQSKSATTRVNTDRVLLDIPILCMGPGGGPVIDLNDLLLGRASTFFGYFVSGANVPLAKVTEVKAFPTNVEVTIQVPVRDGTITTLHYSMKMVEGSPDYKPREADRRVGFFYTNFTDRARNDGESQTVRYAHRWNVQKSEPNAKLTPPKKPIVYYIEHTTPLRYRRWVREGILEWNKAFEKVGITGAIEVFQQDAASGAHMDKDPEDASYSFVRWTNSHMGYAIGPSRANPETGEIIGASVVMDEGFLTGWASDQKLFLPEAAMRGLDGETLEWLAQNPEFDPRVRLAAPGDREAVKRRIAAAATNTTSNPAGTEDRPSLLARATPRPGNPCMAQYGAAVNVNTARMALSAGLLEALAPEGSDPADKASVLDGMPEWFVGPLLKSIVMHEIGHTLGLMHNFKASSIYTLDQINSAEWRGKKTIGGSVMDYFPTNLTPALLGGRDKQGDFCMIGVGPYDMWAIEWGYTSADPKDVVKRVAEKDLAFTSDEGASGPDPLCRVWDLGSDSLKWSEANVKLAKELRARLLDKVMKDGQSWQKLSEHFSKLMWMQSSGVWSATGYIGGASVVRDKKGDPNGRDPVTVVPVADQRAALAFVLENGFRDASFGLTPALMSKMGSDQWWDDEGYTPDRPFHDQILSLQASTLTRLMNPTVLRRVFDNELRVPPGQDVLTMPEMLQAIRQEIWSEVTSTPAAPSAGKFTPREPMISSFRRNLQREHLRRLIVLSTTAGWSGASARPLTNLARQELRELKAIIEKAPMDKLDAYSKSHLADAAERITRAMEAAYIRNE